MKRSQEELGRQQDQKERERERRKKEFPESLSTARQSVRLVCSTENKGESWLGFHDINLFLLLLLSKYDLSGAVLDKHACMQ